MLESRRPPRKGDRGLRTPETGAIQTSPISTRGLRTDDAAAASSSESPGTLPTPSASSEAWLQHSQSWGHVWHQGRQDCPEDSLVLGHNQHQAAQG